MLCSFIYLIFFVTSIVCKPLSPESSSPEPSSPEPFTSLWRQSVFYHNDVEPRNLLVRPIIEVDSGHRRYELARLSSTGRWLASSRPPTSVASRTSSWEARTPLFKQRTAHLLSSGGVPREVDPGARPHQPVEEQVDRTGEAGERSPDFRCGQIRQAGARTVGPFTKEDNESLELEMLRELGYA